MLNCHRVAVTGLVLLLLCETVNGKQSTRHVRRLEREERDLSVLWQKPAYWATYNELFTVKRLKKCRLKKGVPPDNGSYCPTLAIGWYTCLFGEQTCTASPGALPGPGDYVGAALGTGQVHPSMRCDCDSGKWNCYEWDICAKPQSCGSRGLAPCPDGQTCIDPDPSDSCDPAADCPGICAPSPPPSIATDPPVVTDPVEDPPSPDNNKFCPAIVPQSGNKCPAYLPEAAVCKYGTVRCCDAPGMPKTRCSCKNGIFECQTIAIRCAAKCAPAPGACEITKKEWPELVGTVGTDAKAVIEKEEPCLREVVIVRKNQPITKDLRFDRVRIFIDELGNVMSTPRVG